MASNYVCACPCTGCVGLPNREHACLDDHPCTFVRVCAQCRKEIGPELYHPEDSCKACATPSHPSAAGAKKEP
jgi:hypothetical protein